MVKKVLLKNIIIIAMFSAMQIIFSRFLSVQVNDGLRLSFETVPIILAGFWFGPVTGMVVGGLSDILGSVLFPFGPYFPLLTFGPVLLGLVCGIGGRLFDRSSLTKFNRGWILIIIVIIGEVINSLLFGTWALTLYYSMILSKQMPFSVLFIARLPGKIITMIIDSVIVFFLHKALWKSIVSKYSFGGSQKDEL